MKLIYKIIIISAFTLIISACSDDDSSGGISNSKKEETNKEKEIRKQIEKVIHGNTIDDSKAKEVEEYLVESESKYINSLEAKQSIYLYTHLDRLKSINKESSLLLELNLINRLSTNDNFCKDDKFKDYFMNRNRAERLNPIDSAIYIIDSFLLFIKFSRNEIPEMFNQLAETRKKYDLRNYEHDLVVQLEEEVSQIVFDTSDKTSSFSYNSIYGYRFGLGNILGEIRRLEEDYFENSFEVNKRAISYYLSFVDAADLFAETKIEHDLEDIHYRFGRYVDSMASGVKSNAIGYKLLELTEGKYFREFLLERLSNIEGEVTSKSCLGSDCAQLISGLEERVKECY